MRLKQSSCSTKTELHSKGSEAFFTEEERARSNVRGKGSKRRLNPVKIDFVRQKTFNMSPLDAGEEEKAWAKCVCATDEAN